TQAQLADQLGQSVGEVRAYFKSDSTAESMSALWEQARTSQGKAVEKVAHQLVEAFALFLKDTLRFPTEEELAETVGTTAKGIRPVLGLDDPATLLSSADLQCDKHRQNARNRICRLYTAVSEETGETPTLSVLHSELWAKHPDLDLTQEQLAGLFGEGLLFE